MTDPKMERLVRNSCNSLSNFVNFVNCNPAKYAYNRGEHWE